MKASARVLLLFAHPKYEQSQANKALIPRIPQVDGVTFHDLYEHYPDFNIDVAYEKQLLSDHDVIVWQHPLYWYSCPPLLKQWIDVVLEFGWAYGPEGTALQGKQAISVITVGGSRAVYCAAGYNNYSVTEFLRPFEQTARLCGMTYFPPFAVMGTHELSERELERHADQYAALIGLLQAGVSAREIGPCDLFNDAPELLNLVSHE